MEQAIDSCNVSEQLEMVIRELLQKEKNRETSKVFYETIKDLKPKSCEIKTGWVSGDYISFSCKSTKSGEGEIINEIVKGIPEIKKMQYLYFIYGLNPDTLLFNPKFILDEPEFFYFTLTLRKQFA